VSFILSQTAVLLGISSETESALSVDQKAPEVPIISFNDELKISAAFCSIVSDNKLDRVLALLELLLNQKIADSEINFNQTPVFWLLPELTIHDNQTLIEWATALKNAFPILFNHPKTQFFPFGSSAFTVSLNTADSLLKDNNDVSEVCIIAVDTLFHEVTSLLNSGSLFSFTSGEGMIPSEGVAMTCMSYANEGINMLASNHTSATTHQQTQAIETLFSSISNHPMLKNEKSMVSHLYVPGNGLAETTNPWLNAYGCLAGVVGQHTKIKQLGLLTGEIGCVTGLYNFLHIYFAYQHQKISGITLQVDISDRLYQAVSLYSWTSKD